MVALDNTALFGQIRKARVKVSLKLTLAPLVAGVTAIALLLVLGAILARGFSENGFRLGSQLAWRYGFFVFFAALVASPLCRVVARFSGFEAPKDLGSRLVWSFCASYGVYLLSIFLPNVIHLSAGATMMVLFGGGVTLVMALVAAPLSHRQEGPHFAKARRAMLAAATGYFWLSYSVMALARISGPHRPDAFYDISLCLMVVALLVRFADRWLDDHPPAAEPAQRMSNLRQTSVPK